MTPALLIQPGVCPTPIGSAEMANRTCSIDDCDRPHYARGWCNLHWNRWLRHGDPTVHLPSRPLAERFWEKVDRGAPDVCWLWTASTANHGYGYFSLGNGRSCGAHRFSYELVVGPIPDGFEIDHLCRVPACVNPQHLEPVTHLENMRRSQGSGFVLNAAKTHCPQGHPYDEANTIVEATGRRRCRTCHREQSRNYARRKAVPR